MNERLQRLVNLRGKAVEELEKLQASRKAITDLVRDAGREELSAEEDTEYREKTQEIATKQTEIKGFDERIKELSEEEARAGDLDEGAKAVRKAQQQLSEVREAAAYEKGNKRSYFVDLIRMQIGQDGDGQAAERLRRHAVDVATDKAYRDLDRVDGNGGYFVPPVHLLSKYAEYARAGRVYANLLDNQPLPAGTDSISIPRIVAGTGTAIQTADNAAVAEVDMDDAIVEAKVRTVAGQQDIAIQLLDQSPINFDEVIFRDLMADYAAKVDLQVLAGSGANGQVLGVHNTPGIEPVAITGGATVAKFYSAVADAIQRVNTKRVRPATHIVVHPRRWAWLTASLDDNQRPLVVPAAQAPQNSVASFAGVIAEGVVGTMQGLPIVSDPNIGTAYGSGETPSEDVAYVQKSDDLILFESGIKSRVMQEVGSGNLTVRLQVYGYIAFTAGRYPKSIVEITGLGAPTF